jgi:serine protease Do
VLPRLLSSTLLMALLCGTACTVAVPQANAHTPDIGASQADLIATLVPAVVSITAISYQSGPTDHSTTVAKQTAAALTKKSLIGSGFIVEPSGYIVTNRHVVEGGNAFFVTLADGRRLRAQLIAKAVDVDVAVIKIHDDKPFPVVKIGDSDTVRQGDPVIAIGNPLGFSSSVSTGVISALDRDIRSSIYDDYMQTDAAINHGNSGGPLFNAAGEVIGITSDIYATSDNGGSIGIGFAIPSNDAKFVVWQLLDYHRIEPGYLGVNVQQVTPELASSLGMEEPWGSLVSSDQPGSPAEQAGIRVGDVIRSFDGKDQHNIRGLMRIIGQTPAGKTVSIGMVRDGKPVTVQATLQLSPENAKFAKAEAAPPAPPPPPKAVDLGLKLAQISPALRGKFKIAAAFTGLVVTEVAADTTAAEHGIKPGDVIVMINDAATPSIEAFRKTVDQVRGEKRAFARALVESDGNLKWVPLHVEQL